VLAQLEEDQECEMIYMEAHHTDDLRTPFTDLNLYWIKGHWRLFVLVSFF